MVTRYLERPAVRRHGIAVSLSLRIFWAKRLTNMCKKVDAVDELHGIEPKPSVGNQVVEGNQVGVSNISQGTELVLEAKQ